MQKQDKNSTKRGVCTEKTGQKQYKNEHLIRRQEVPLKSYPKTDARHWKNRIKKRSEDGTWQLRLQMRGRDTWFDLLTSNQTDASHKAVEVFLFAKANGLEAAIEKFKAPKPESGEIVTVGQFIAAIAKPAEIRGQTWKQYHSTFRQICWEIGATPSQRERYDRLKFDYRGEGRRKWISKVDEIGLFRINKESVKAWRGTKNPPTAASQIRQAKAFCALADHGTRQNTKHFPFADIPTRQPKAKRHQTLAEATGEALMVAAYGDLREKQPEAWKAFLLALAAGLRKEEIDSLLWAQVDLAEGRIRLDMANPYFSAKSEEAHRSVDLSEDITRELAALKARSTGPFVLKGAKGLPVVRQYKGYYRAKPTWAKLTAWLKGKGVHVQKPVHYLRKESGSLIASSHGIEAARRHLGHADIATTSNFYSDKKGKTAVNITMPGPKAEPAGEAAS